MKDHQGNQATAKVYTIMEEWYVGWFGMVAVGNDRYTLGCLKQTKCTSREEAELIAQRL